MSFAEEMADLARELLSEEEDMGAEPILIQRVTAGTGPATYNPATRTIEPAATPAPLEQTVRGILDAELPRPDGLIGVFERVLYAAPLTSGGFEPAEEDRLPSVEGRAWIVKATGHVIKQGIPILWICGLASA